MTGRNALGAAGDPRDDGAMVVRVESTGVTAEEAAAAIAVVTSLLAQPAPRGPSAAPQTGWTRSIRGMRSTLRPGPGAWSSWF